MLRVEARKIILTPKGCSGRCTAYYTTGNGVYGSGVCVYNM